MQKSLFFYLRTTRQFTTPRVVNTGTASYTDDDVHSNKIKFLYVIFGVVKSDNRLSTGYKLLRV